MADEESPLQQHAPGGHYSGHNKIPTVKQFLDKLDGDKKTRDADIDAQTQAQNQAAANGEVIAHKNTPEPKKKQKSVTDPTTGRQVVIEDVNKSMVDASRNPTV